MTKYNEAPDTSNRKTTLPPLPSLQEPLPVIGADRMAIAFDPFFAVHLGRHTTGLANNIWLSPRGQAGHTARIWVQLNHHQQFEIDHVAVVSVEEAPPQVIEGRLNAVDLNRVRRYIALNRQAILDHWYGLTDGAELSRALKPLKPA